MAGASGKIAQLLVEEPIGNAQGPAIILSQAIKDSTVSMMDQVGLRLKGVGKHLAPVRKIVLR